jgi:8-oxo-dGTP pyrophosphatase MutT (NUDIX family)
MKQNIKQEVSAGGVVYRQIGMSAGQQAGKSDDCKIEFLIGKHSGYHKWVLPKGMVEKGESLLETALREVEEEVGVKARIVEVVPLKTIEYWYYADLDLSGKTTRRVARYAEAGGEKTKVHKKVVFYLMELEGDLGNAGWEMEERRWVSYKEGLELLAFEKEREVWEMAGRQLGASDQN